MDDTNALRAVAILKPASRFSRNPETWFLLSRAYALTGEWRRAAKCADTALEHNPTHERAIFLRARIASNADEHDRSREILRRLGHSRKPWVRLKLANRLLESHAEEEALAVASALMRDLEGDPSDRKRWARAGVIRTKALIRLERLDVAQDTASELASSPFPIAKARGAQLLLQLGNPLQAWSAVESIALDSQFADLILRIGRSLVDVGHSSMVFAVVDEIEASAQVSQELQNTAQILKAIAAYSSGDIEEANTIALDVATTGTEPQRRRAALLLLDKGDPVAGWRALERLDKTIVNAGDLVKASRHLHRQGHLRVAAQAADEAARRPGDQAPVQRMIRHVAGNLKLLDHGLSLDRPREQPFYEPVENRAVYLLHNSLPVTSGGYATRTHGLLTGLVEHGWDVIGATRLGYPDDRVTNPSPSNEDTVDGVRYLRLRDREKPGPLDNYLLAYAHSIEVMATRERPGILHAASNFWNGAAANLAGRRLGIPTIYEVRGLWEITRRSRQPEWVDTDTYTLYRRMETEAAQGADVVITITSALRDELVGRGVPFDKIVLVPNAVDTTRFHPVPPDRDLKAQLGFKDETIIGYVGSVVDYEGLDDLITAVARLTRTITTPFKVLIVGDGAAYEDVQGKTENAGLSEVVTFTGRVAHEDVERYYSLIDVICLPRKPCPVTEMVSPIKPFESMAMAKPLVVSSVSALAEIVHHEETGLIFEKGNVDALTRMLEQAISSRELQGKLGNAAMDWVRRERDWRVITRRVSEIYQSLICSSDTHSNCQPIEGSK